MPRDVSYYFDFARGREDLNWRFRIIMFAGDSSTLDTSQEPEWMGDPAGGAPWERIPNGVILKISPIKAAYEGNATGLPDTSTAVINWELAPLFESSALQDLQQYIMNPIAASAGRVLAGSVTRAFDTSTMLVILSDRGDSAIDIDHFHVLFAGSEKKDLKRVLEIDAVAGSIRYQSTFVHLARLVPESLTPDDLSHQLVDLGLYTTSGPWHYLVDAYWSTSDPYYYAHLIGSVGSTHLEFTLYRLSDVLRGVKVLLDQVFSAWMRGGATFEVRGTNNLGPWNDDMLKLFKPDFTASYAHQPGTFVNAGSWFIGTAAWSDAPDTPVTGKLIRNDEDSIYAHETLYDFLHAHVSGTTIKGIVQQGGRRSITVSYYTLSGGDNLALTPASFKAKMKAEPGREIVAEVDAEIPGAVQGDLGTVKSRMWGTSNDQGGTVPVTFHTMPRVGDVNEVSFYENSGHGFMSQLPDTTNIALSPRPWFGTLFTLATPPGATGDVPVRVSHYVTIQGRTDCMDAVVPALPTPGPGDLDIPFSLGVFDKFWYPLRLSLLAMQGKAGMPWAATAFCANTFSSENQIAYPGAVSIDHALIDYVGLPADPSWTSANQFLPNPPFPATTLLSNFSGTPVLTSTEIDIDQLRSTVLLIATDPG